MTSAIDQFAKALRSRTILIVDDQRFVRSMVSASLEDIERIEVIQAEDGTEALTILQEKRIDAVVLDINMVPMDGLKTLKAIRTGTYGIDASVPIVMLTSMNDMSVVRTCGELDCQGFLLKPVSKMDLLSRLARAVRGQWNLREPGYYWGVEMPTIIPVGESGVAPEISEATVTREARPGHEIKKVAINDLQANDVLVEDLRTSNGNTMLAEGTELTQPMIERLQDLRKMAATNQVNIEREFV